MPQCGVALKRYRQLSEVFRPIHVRAAFEDGARKSCLKQSLPHVGKGKTAAPPNPVEQSRRATPQSDEVKPSIGARSQHRLGGLQFIQCQAQLLPSERRRICADDDGAGMFFKKIVEGAVKPLSELPPLLLPQHKLPRDGMVRHGASCQKQIKPAAKAM